MPAWQVLLLGELVADSLLMWQFIQWRRRKLDFKLTVISWGLAGWAIFLLGGWLTEPTCLSNSQYWLATGLAAWFSGPSLILWWLYSAYRWRPQGLIAQIYRKLFSTAANSPPGGRG